MRPRSTGCRACVTSCKVDDTAVAVVADTWWQAKKALDALPVAWEEGPNSKVSSATIAEHLKEGLTAAEVHVSANRSRRCAGGDRRRGRRRSRPSTRRRSSATPAWSR